MFYLQTFGRYFQFDIRQQIISHMYLKKQAKVTNSAYDTHGNLY